MDITLGARTEESVAVYFEKARTELIRRTLPQKAETLDEALADFRRTQCPGATSFGRTILAGNRYIGDVWCYAMDAGDEPQAMISYCVFEPECWNRGAATQALHLFLAEVRGLFGLRVFGAFTYAANAASRRVLEKNGFTMRERFFEDGVESCYYQCECEGTDNA